MLPLERLSRRIIMDSMLRGIPLGNNSSNKKIWKKKNKNLKSMTIKNSLIKKPKGNIKSEL